MTSSFWNSQIGRFIDRLLPVGPRSVLFGAHCFFIHPFFVAYGWYKLYGFPKDIAIWASFFLHDTGYLAQWCRDMDGPEGERHPEFGAWLMHLLFDDPVAFFAHENPPSKKWHDFCLYHSRYYAKRDGATPSKLCAADKLAYTYTPWWLFIPMTRLTGKIEGYMALSKTRAEAGEPVFAPGRGSNNPYKRWYFTIQEYSQRWAYQHKNGVEDTWTPKLYTHT